ncbi:MAG: 8-oxoguanine DNA glycosylase, partial [Oscillospiraceae bacterium]|nr:8-oxoguanine DNA glycosylase [Oscillospiraceae bacterium]
MVSIQNDYFSLEKITASGQCFRWRRLDDGCYEIPAFGKILHARQSGGTVRLDCSEGDYDAFWHNYFDLDCDYAQYHRAAEESGLDFLAQAAEYSRGIRILRQELWETLLSFIISQNNNIPRICLCLERIIARFGYFPAREELIEGSLAGLGLGYREAYLYDAARRFSPGMCDFSAILGVGPKVNSCVRLFALGMKDEFPRDVWIKRIETERFGGHFPEEQFPGFAGVLQQF